LCLRYPETAWTGLPGHTMRLARLMQKGWLGKTQVGFDQNWATQMVPNRLI
jgi:hypothetical protein